MVPFVLCRSGLQLKPHLRVTASPASLTCLQVFLETTPFINEVHGNTCLRVLLLGTRPKTPTEPGYSLIVASYVDPAHDQSWPEKENLLVPPAPGPALFLACLEDCAGPSQVQGWPA